MGFPHSGQGIETSPPFLLKEPPPGLKGVRMLFAPAVRVLCGDHGAAPGAVVQDVGGSAVVAVF